MGPARTQTTAAVVAQDRSGTTAVAVDLDLNGITAVVVDLDLNGITAVVVDLVRNGAVVTPEAIVLVDIGGTVAVVTTDKREVSA